MPKNFKKIFIFIFALSLVFVVGNTVLAQIDTGINEVSGIGLGDTDPRVMIANVIRVILGFLGIIALLLIMYAGFLWITSNGDSSKIDRAKKILISAVIGLVIILSSFAIASFILSKILGASTGTGSGTGGGGTVPLPGGGGTGTLGLPCDGNTLTPVCDADDTLCTSGVEYCEPTSCTCQSLGGVGDPCDLDTMTPICDPDDTMCASGLSCDGTTCLCQGAPIIDWVSPVDSLGTPNGAVGDFVTIGGRFFGTTTGQVYFSDASGNPTILASFPSSVNVNCTNNWTDGQIIVVVPAGAQDGPVRVVRDLDLEEDVTNNARGPVIDDFLINIINRPGLCLTNPNNGYYEDAFNLQGISFSGSVQGVYFGNNLSSSTAININTWTNTSVNASVPNIGGGNNTVFVNVDGASSNVLNFNVLTDINNNPIIDYIDPSQGPPGQYITIYGNNFGNTYLSPAEVLFTAITTSATYTADGLDFPLECQNSWWRNNHIIVKVPPAIGADIGDYEVTITNNSGFTSIPEAFVVTSGDPGPGICEMVPHNGPIGQPVEIIGDNFSSAIGSVEFYNGVVAPSITSWSNQSIETSVPVGAETGAVIAISTSPSNSFPFMVGECSSDSQCSAGEECCGSTTYWDGICRASGTCDAGTPVTTTGYGWTFNSTGIASTSASSTLTCSGWSGDNACLVDGNSCPNSPGECQTDPAPVTGFCSDSYCEAVPGCGPGNCEYDVSLNRCVASPTGAYQNNCDGTSSTVVPGYDATCVLVNSVVGEIGAWQIQTGGASCPTGTYLDANGWCTVGNVYTGPTPSCDICDSGFSCVSGQCVIGASVCNNGSSCDTGSGLCIGSATCECCCEVAANDCCLGLTCEAGGCGDLSNPVVQANYGQCTGCRVEDGVDNTSVSPSEQASSNLACNCEGTTGKVCNINPSAPVSDPLHNGVCVDAPTPTGGGLGDPCDMDTTNAVCDPDSTMCLGGFYCDPSSCSCEAEETFPGALCVQEVNIGLSTTYTCNPAFACGTGYSCIDNPFVSDPIEDCGTCCCDPTIPETIVTAGGDTLICQSDKSPCGGANRGLYCGCESDLECGNPNISACGTDTCCRPRPQVINTSPPDEPTTGSDNVCRNVMLEATFNTEMNISTFRGNMTLLGDYGNEPCPEGTQYLTMSNTNEKKGNIIVRTFNNIKNKISSWLSGEVVAYTPVGVTNNFCAIKGKTDGYNDTSGQGVLTFSPNRPLDGDTRYYAIIVGDETLDDDNPQGVLDRFGVSMGTASTFTEAFNSIPYENSYIWSFTTMSDQGENQGLCVIDYVDVSPASYLIQTTENSLAEDDADPLSDSFDTVTDSDKLFVATARTISGQRLNPLAGLYDWAWSWLISNTGVADIVPVAGLSDDKKLIRAQTTATEGNTLAEATAAVSGTFASAGETHTGSAYIYLFLCNNPWPPIDSAGLWAPWRDRENNCTLYPEGPGTCGNTNYEFYYCRDQGADTTFDDLPPILNDAIIRGRDTDQNLFKEYYFFREATPDLSSMTLDVASVPAEGGSVNIWWDNFVPAPGETLDQFLVYYGTTSGDYTNTIEVGPTIPHSLASPFNIPYLVNGQVYYFAITAVYTSGAESDFSNEISATPEDTLAPSPSTIINAAIGNAQAEIEWNPVADAVEYKLYWKAGSGCGASSPPDCYASSQSVGDATAAVITDLTNGSVYYFAVTAIDSAGNESPYSNEVSVIPAVTSASVLSGATQVALGWISSNVASLDDIYYVDLGIVAGAFEEFEGEEGNRINLFGNIIKYIFKKISYSFANEVEAQSIPGEIKIPLCSDSPGTICRDQIIENDGKHSTVIKNLTNGRKYKFIIKNGPATNQTVIDDIVVDMKESITSGSEISYGEKCNTGDVCAGDLICRQAHIDFSGGVCCRPNECSIWEPGGSNCFPEGEVRQLYGLSGYWLCSGGEWETKTSY